MPIRSRSPLGRRYRINEGDMLMSLHRLLCAVLANDAIEARAANNPDDPLMRLQVECFQDEVTHLLVSTAAFNRVYRMQKHPRRVTPDKVTIDPVKGTCGKLLLQKDGHNLEEKPLSFRDACDKIVHANLISFDAINKTFWLNGEWNRKGWSAGLDLVEYVRLSARNFDPIYYE